MTMLADAIMKDIIATNEKHSDYPILKGVIKASDEVYIRWRIHKGSMEYSTLDCVQNFASSIEKFVSSLSGREFERMKKDNLELTIMKLSA